MLTPPYKYTNLGFTTLSVGTAAVGTVSLPGLLTADKVKYALIYVGGAAINYRDDATNPAVGTSGTVGMPVGTAQYISYDGEITRFKAIAQSGSGTAVLSINLYG